MEINYKIISGIILWGLKPILGPNVGVWYLLEDIQTTLSDIDAGTTDSGQGRVSRGMGKLD